MLSQPWPSLLPCPPGRVEPRLPPASLGRLRSLTGSRGSPSHPETSCASTWLPRVHPVLRSAFTESLPRASVERAAQRRFRGLLPGPPWAGGGARVGSSAQTTSFAGRWSFRPGQPCGCTSGGLTPRNCASILTFSQGLPTVPGCVCPCQPASSRPSPWVLPHPRPPFTAGQLWSHIWGYRGSLWFQCPFAPQITAAFVLPTTSGKWEAEELSGCVQWEALAGR